MIIDVSNTIGRHKFKPEITAEELLRQMDVAGVDMAVIFCYPECLDNESVYRAIKAYPNRFIGLYTVNPWQDNAVEELEDAIKNKGFKGLYMHPLRHGYMLTERLVFYPLLDVCRKYGVPVWCYGSADVSNCPVLFNQMAEDYPDVNFIMGRMGQAYDTASAVEVAKRYPNVYLETAAGMDFHAHRAMKTAGIDKVMIGTGTPDCNYFELELAKVRNAAKNYPDGEEKVLWRNAARIFHVEVNER